MKPPKHTHRPKSINVRMGIPRVIKYPHFDWLSLTDGNRTVIGNAHTIFYSSQQQKERKWIIREMMAWDEMGPSPISREREKSPNPCGTQSRGPIRILDEMGPFFPALEPVCFICWMQRKVPPRLQLSVETRKLAFFLSCFVCSVCLCFLIVGIG